MKLYESRLKQLKIETDETCTVHDLKRDFLKHLPDTFIYVFFVFQHDIGAALAKVVEKDNDDDAVQLAHTAKIVRKDLFEKSFSFNGSFRKGCQEDSVPELLFALVSMIVDDPNIRDQISTTQTTLTIAQLLKFNAVRHQRKGRAMIV